MRRFFRENWIWIATPPVVLGVLVVVLWFLSRGEEGWAPFEYALY